MNGQGTSVVCRVLSASSLELIGHERYVISTLSSCGRKTRIQILQ